MNSVAQMVKGDKKVTFTKYRQNHVYYVTECGFEFPIPLDDVADATLHYEEKAIMMMRWIRKHHKIVSENI